MTTRFFFRPASACPPEAVPPGTPDAWPFTLFALEDGEPDPTDPALVGPKSGAEMDAHFASLQAAWDAAAGARAAWREALELPGLKLTRIAEIDAKTTEVIFRGFTYGGKVLSLSASAQANLLGALGLRTGYSYPINWNCLDDMEPSIVLADADAVLAMCVAAATAKRVALDSGTALRQDVLAATTKAELDAVVDSR